MTGSPQTDPEWLVEGGSVLTHNHERAERGRIARLTKRDVVLEDGQRFNRAHLSRSGAGPGLYTASWYLCAPTDRTALEMLHQQRVRAVLTRLENAVVEHRRVRRVDSAAVRATLRSALAALEQLEAGDDR